MSVQVKRRRDTAANVAAFTPAQGELIVDITNNRLIVGDGATVGGWPAARSIDMPGGFVNKFINGTMGVWPEGTSFSATTSGRYTADGWIVTPTGASVAVSQSGGLRLTKAALQITGASGVTDVMVSQRIESYIAAQLCGQQVTVQVLVNNQTGSAIVPTLTVKRPATQDGWGGSIYTDINAVNLQSCANNASTLLSYTFAANSACYQGLQISFDFGNNFGSGAKSISLSEADIRVTPWAGVGFNGAPAAELRLDAIEAALGQRNFVQMNISNGFTFIDQNAASAGVNLLCPFTLPVPMRAIPTTSIFGTVTASNCSSTIYPAAGGNQLVTLSSSATAAGRAFVTTSSGFGFSATARL